MNSAIKRRLLSRRKLVVFLLLSCFICASLVKGSDEDLKSIRGSRDSSLQKPRLLLQDIQIEFKGRPKSNMSIVFSLGQGTTGTRALFNGMCYLNVTGVHYGQFCFNAENTSDLSHDQVVAIKAQVSLIRLISAFTKCAGKDGNSCSLEAAMKILHEMKISVARVIFSGTVDFISDTPYPNLVSFVKEAILEARPGLEPLYLMTERDPQEWTTRRIATHPSHVFCRYYFDLEDREVEMFDNEHPEHDPLDWSHCVKYATRHPPKEDAVATEIFVTLQQLIKETGANENSFQKVVARTQRAYERYQNKCLQMQNLIYKIDFFKMSGRTAVEVLAKDLYEKSFNSNSLQPHSREAFQKAGVILLNPEDPTNNAILNSRTMGSSFINEVIKMP